MSEIINARKKLLYYDLLICLFLFPGVQIPALFYRIFYSSGRVVYSSISIDMLLNTRMGIDLSSYVLAMLGLHAGLAVFVWYLTDRLLVFFRCNTSRYLIIGVLLMLLVVYWLIIANHFYYPNSAYHPLPEFTYPGKAAHGDYDVIAVLLAGAALAAIFASLYKIRNSQVIDPAVNNAPLQRVSKSQLRIPLIVVTAIITASWLVHGSVNETHQPHFEPVPVSNKDLPNIIIIGIDSLRPDLVGKSLNGVPITPNLHSFIEHAATIETAITPLAKTYPAWMSILTGTYPVHNGTRFNLSKLYPQQERPPTLAEILNKKGYFSIYATDDKRFSNIDDSHGFNKILGPKIGAADFLISHFYDVPLSNLVSNTRAGKELFPYIYANRAADVTYKPETFVSLIDSYLDTAPAQQPLFMGIHLCLPHWPFTWSEKSEDMKSENNRYANYIKTLMAADRQFFDIVQSLSKHGYLQNTIMVVLSDHGERFDMDAGISVSDLQPGKFPNLVSRVGHGTDVVSEQQYKVLLGFRGFGPIRFIARTIKGNGSLVDVAPTLLDIIGSGNNPGLHFDGVSLYQALRGNLNRLPMRNLFTETGFYVKAMMGDSIDPDEVASQSVKHYTVAGNGYLLLKPSVIDKLLYSKQYAVIHDNWSYIVSPGETKRDVVQALIDHTSGQVHTIDNPLFKGFSGLHSKFCHQYSSDPRIMASRICKEQTVSPRHNVQ